MLEMTEREKHAFDLAIDPCTATLGGDNGRALAKYIERCQKGATCNCISQVNETLKPKGLRLVTTLLFSKDLSHNGVTLLVPIEKIEKGDRKIKVTTMVAPFCPFCGARQQICQASGQVAELSPSG